MMQRKCEFREDYSLPRQGEESFDWRKAAREFERMGEKELIYYPQKTKLELIFIHGRKGTPFCPDLSNIPFPSSLPLDNPSFSFLWAALVGKYLSPA